MIESCGKYIAVKEIQSDNNVLLIGDSVGLEKVKIVSISRKSSEDLYYQNYFKVKNGSEVYIKVGTEPHPYISVDNEKVFFVTIDDIVAVEPDTVDMKTYLMDDKKCCVEESKKIEESK